MSEGDSMTDIYEWWDKIPYKYVVMECLRPISKLKLERFYFNYCNSSSDGMFGVMEKQNYFWNEHNEFITPLLNLSLSTKQSKKLRIAYTQVNYLLLVKIFG